MTFLTTHIKISEITATNAVYVSFEKLKTLNEYPTMMRVSKDGQAVFPKITVCLNSMHSKQYLTFHYPDLEVGCFSSGTNLEHLTLSYVEVTS